MFIFVIKCYKNSSIGLPHFQTHRRMQFISLHFQCTTFVSMEKTVAFMISIKRTFFLTTNLSPKEVGQASSEIKNNAGFVAK